MKSRIPATLLGVVLAGWTGATIAAQEVDLGKQEFMGNCAVCHGASGTGDGIDLLRTSPADLTTLSQRNGGVFPIARVYDTIDGRANLAAHGTRDMPIWGREYSIGAADYYIDVVNYDSEKFVRTRILALIDYLYRLQK